MSFRIYPRGASDTLLVGPSSRRCALCRSEVEELRRQVALRAAEVRDRESELCLQQMALQEARHGQQQLTREYEVVSADLLAYRTKIETYARNVDVIRVSVMIEQLTTCYLVL